jgi:serine/threonine protein kinase
VPTLQEGVRLGEFEIIAPLGQGAMGAVYKARQTVLKRLVAIKTLQPTLASDAEFVTRFHNEAIAAAALNHPNLVQVYAANETDGIHWFAMEFVDGENAQSRLTRLGKLQPGEALAICMHVQTGLAYGWRKANLIHRDIKPDNIFLSNDGDVKLGDLGLAKSSDHQHSLTMTGASMGTPLYISPEQAEGRRDIDLRTDIYSLGATLYHLIAGAPPYTGESVFSLMTMHVNAPVPDIRELEPILPAALAAVIQKCMQKAPADRYGNYEELGAALAEAYTALFQIPDAPTQQPPAAQNSPAQSSARKNNPALWISAIALIVMALGALFFFTKRYTTDSSATRTGAPQQGSAATPTEKIPPALHPQAPPEPPKAKTAASAKPKQTPPPKPDPDSLKALVRKLESKLLPVPGCGVSMSKTELTVGEWKLYLQARGLPPWEHPIEQTDEHPRVTNWDIAREMCEWLTGVTGTEWRMPTNSEWQAAAGDSKFPWGDSYPPRWDEGNYCALEDGSRDPKLLGVDGIRGPAPVASFKPNPLGFYDMGGNVSEWAEDEIDARGWRRVRGCGAFSPTTPEWLATVNADYSDPTAMQGGNGFRIVRGAAAAKSK